MSNLIRFVRIISEKEDMITSSVLYFRQLIKAGHKKEKLAIALAKFCGNYNNYLWKYNIHTREECIKKFIEPILTQS